MSEWISVKERLPDDIGNVLIFDFNEGIRVGYYDGTDFIDEMFSQYNAVTHWQPLPEAPKEE